jgi:putative heme iron utilization protein
MPEHESRLDRALRALLLDTPVATLGTLAEDGAPQVSMVPFVPLGRLGGVGGAGLLIHVSALAAHSRHMRRDPRVSLLVMAPPGDAGEALALPRVTIEGTAIFLEAGDSRWEPGRALYLARFAEAALTTTLPDFSFVLIEPRSARHVAGFGAARTLDGEALAGLMTRTP